eukprot:scaffold1167_cov418-Prasinococcus_capsulatus_cf.AAC.10
MYEGQDVLLLNRWGAVCIQLLGGNIYQKKTPNRWFKPWQDFSDTDNGCSICSCERAAHPSQRVGFVAVQCQRLRPVRDAIEQGRWWCCTDRCYEYIVINVWNSGPLANVHSSLKLHARGHSLFPAATPHPTALLADATCLL